MVGLPRHRQEAAPGGAESALRSNLQRLEAQLLALKQELRQAEQLATLGTAAAMMAHEFNNLMTPVVGYCHMALDAKDPALMTKAVEMTLKQSAIITSMTDRILSFAVNEPTRFTDVALRGVVEEAVACLCRDPAKDRITLKILVDESVHVRADAKSLQQVFFNLLLNSRRALNGKSGTIIIEAEKVAQHRVRVRVRDTGCGMSAERLITIFEPYITTKETEAGATPRISGLGLAICRNILREHESTIEATSAPGQGTTFTIDLPAAEAPAMTCVAPVSNSLASRRGDR